VLCAAGLASPVIKQMLPCMQGGDGGPNEITTRALVDDLRSEGERGRSGIILLVRKRSFLWSSNRPMCATWIS
jgi:hypothetical protein